MIAALAQRVLSTSPGGRAVIAVDGVDCSGKTTLADRLAQQVRPHRPVVRASVDGFHRPRTERYRRGRESPEGCYRDTFDLDALQHRLLAPFVAGSPYETAVFDVVADAPVALPAVDPEPDAVLVVDGVFLQRAELSQWWDLVVHLQAPDEEVLRRAALRDGVESLALYRARYLPAQRLYEAECRAAERADVLVDTADVAAPVAVRGL